MPWSNQGGSGGGGGGGWKSGGGGGGGGPWGQGPSGGGGNQPPDLEDLLKRSQDRLKQVFDGLGLTIYQIANMSGPAVGGLLFTLPLAGAMIKWKGAPLVS